jgi:3-hydroxyisobutyrate dehydrogenase
MLNPKMKIGFIGIGVMGKSMATHILNSGLTLYVYNRTKLHAQSLLDKGAIWKETVADLSSQVDVIISIVGYPKDVEEIYFGDQGIIDNAKPGSTLIDMTTSKPSLAKQIYKEAKNKGLNSLDAPVSGGDIGAKNSTLTIMVGGDQEIFEKMKPILNLMGTNIVFQGNSGAGQHTKMCNQIAIASNMIGVSEAMLYAKKAGLDPETVLKSIESGAAGSWSLSNLAPKMINGDFEPGFYVKHFVKDMNIALSEAKGMGFNAPGLELSKSLYDELITIGKENKGTQILYQLLDK